MIHPVPPGTRDVLPDELRELRALTARLHEVWAGAGYGEVRTPTLEFEEVLRRGDARAAGAGFRSFDDHGNLLALRSDATIPIARLLANRYADVEDPIRLCYFEHAYRLVRVRSGQPREFLQGGLELVGVPSPGGDAEVVALVLEGLTRAGLGRHRVGLGDASLYGTLLSDAEVPEADREPLLEALARRDLVELEALAAGLPVSETTRRTLIELPQLRGGPEVLDRVAGPAVEGLRAVYELLAERGLADRVIFDLGLVRELGYYTGMVFEVYDPAVGFTIGGGGRYDDLLARFGRSRPACGAGLDIDRVHLAQLAEERLA